MPDTKLILTFSTTLKIIKSAIKKTAKLSSKISANFSWCDLYLCYNLRPARNVRVWQVRGLLQH